MNSLIRSISLLVFSAVVIIMGCTNPETIYISDLKCENLKEPLAINTTKPRFSWKNQSDKQGVSQTAYQIIVGTDAHNLNEKEELLWNSYKVESSSSIMVEYNGKPLHSGQLLYWKVRVWDDQGNSSKWSKPVHFGIGLLNKDDWSASFINDPNDKGFHSSPQFRKTFNINKTEIKKDHLLHVNSLGYHEVFINGRKINDDVLSPAVSQFNKRSLAVTYDISSSLRTGDNELIIWLGSGWYSEGLPGVTGKGPALRVQLEQIYNGINKTKLTSDSSWLARESEYTRISDWMSGRYGGEIIKGNLEIRSKVFEAPDDLKWNKVTIVEVPEHETSPQMVEPNKITHTVHPVSVTITKDDTYLVDIGKCISGWFEVTFENLIPDQEITIEYSDHLDDSGEIVNQQQVDKYIASGNGTEFFINKFNYHGFRYIRISNLKQAPELDKMKAHLVHTDFETVSSFECSDKDLNDIHNMVLYTLKNVGLGGYLVDCPQLERLGYGGDGNASTITAQTMFNMGPLYNNWIQAWADVIDENGSMPHTAPNPYPAGGGPYWCGFIISASWNTYQNYKDIRILENNYSLMQRWLKYVDNHSINGLLKKWPDTENRAWYLGDWATPDGVGDPNHLDERSVDLVNNCYISVCYDQMKEIARVLGKENDVNHYTDKREKLNKIIHDTFYDSSQTQYATGSQIDMIFPMLAGVAPKELWDQLTNVIREKTLNEYGGHLNTGLVGIPVMMEWATIANQPDFIYSMLKKRTYPGYLYMIDRGATTTWEHWNGERSRIHNCFNGVGQWFYQAVGGIRSITGKEAYSEFIIDPQIPKGVTWAKTNQTTPNGTIAVNWELHNETMEIELEVPIGSIARLVPPKQCKTIRINKEVIQSNENYMNLISGKYSIEYVF